jgi:lysozyme family protein
MPLGFKECLAFAWQPGRDGQGYHVTPGDRGGPTSWGCTEPVWAKFAKDTGRSATLATASKGDISACLYSEIWMPAGSGLPSPANLLVFDFAMTSAPWRSVDILQGILHVKIDSQVGQFTIDAAQGFDPAALCTALHAAHRDFYASISGAEHEGGWFTRNDAALAVALAALAA